MTTSLPIDIIVTEILSRLPAKDVVRFKCVSKSFKTLISTPEFIDLHLRHSLSSDDHCLIALNGVSKGFCTFELNSQKNSVVHYPYPDCMNPCIFFIGSANGLLCIGNRRHEQVSVLVINPYTNIYRNIEFEPATLDRLVSCGFGFWYDDANDDYKVVAAVIHFCIFDDLIGSNKNLEIWIYSLRANSWRSIEKKSSKECVIEGDSALVDNHLIHWKFDSRNETVPDRIRCFDLYSERWADEDVPLPECKFRVVDISVLDGCLCFLTTTVDLWVMKEYGVKESWIKLINFSELRPTITTCPLTSRKISSNNSQEILLKINPELTILGWYNIGDNTFRLAVTHGVPLYSQVYMFKPSLVVFPGGHPITPTINKG